MEKKKKIKPAVLISHIIISLAYPIFRSVTADCQKLLVFTDTLTIIAGVLAIGGILYGLYLHGDFDISGYVFRRGMKNSSNENFAAYKENQKEQHAASFNYPLFLSVLYFLLCIFLAYLFL